MTNKCLQTPFKPLNSGFIFVCAVLILITCQAQFASAALRPAEKAASPKSFAVFVASFDPQTHAAHGGVAGTAFFTSPTTAITAFHVLQPASFKSSRTQVWLIHENEPAIAIAVSQLRSTPAQDMTLITLNTEQAVSPHYVFPLADSATSVSAHIAQSEGFLANSVGPVVSLHRETSGAERLMIESIPHLERIQSQGEVIAQAPVNLKSLDVNLVNTPCYQLNYKPIVGISGGPVIVDGKVVAMNSFADPQGRTRTWAVRISRASGT